MAGTRYNDAFGYLREEDGSYVAAPEGAMQSSGGFYVDPTSGQRYSPDAKKSSSLSLPSITSLSGSSGDDLTGMLSASVPSVNNAEIEAQTRKQYAPARDSLESRFKSRIDSNIQQGAQEKRSLEGAMGTGRRFSSSAQAFIQFIQGENAKKVAELEVQMEDALANFDMNLAQVINQRIQTERQNQQQDFENMFKIMNVAKQMQDEQAAANAPKIKAAREGAIIGAFKEEGADAATIFEKINFDENGTQIGDFSIDEITGVLDKFAKDRTEIDKLLVELGKNGTQPDVIAKVAGANTLAEAVMLAGDSLQTGTGVVGEYLYYKREAKALGQTAISFNDYQTMDANRKRPIVNVNQSGLSGTQTQNFLRITDKYQADPIIMAADKGRTAVQIANQIMANPNDATNQLKALYVLVKNLDPDSAVREGEVALAEQTQSYLQRWETKLARVQQGVVISPDVAKQLAQATIQLSSAWQTSAETRTQRYVSQAKNADPAVGQAFGSYLNDYKELAPLSTEVTNVENTAKQKIIDFGNQHPEQRSYIRQLAQEVQSDLGRPYTYQEIMQILDLD